MEFHVRKDHSGCNGEHRLKREQKGWNRLGYHSNNSREKEQHLNETGDKNEQETDSRDSQEIKSTELSTKLDMKA